MIRWWYTLGVMLLLLVAGCSKGPVTYREKELGYKGKAELNPWLAAQRFLSLYGHEVEVLQRWREPNAGDRVWLVPADLISNQVFADRIDTWLKEGGHLVCLLDYEEFTSDWKLRDRRKDFDPRFRSFAERYGFKVSRGGGNQESVKSMKYRGLNYEVNMTSEVELWGIKGAREVMTSVKVGAGRLTMVADARPFRNRWIGDFDHAALLKALVEGDSSEAGRVVFVRNTLVSFWGVLMDRAWAVVLGCVVLLGFGLWKYLPRFGPMEAEEEPSPLRAYEHHLEALGDFQWRLDKGAALLTPLRNEVVELSQRRRASQGRHDDDLFAFMSEFSGVSRERVIRAMTDPAPADAGIFTHVVSDLQRLLQSLR